MIHLFRDGTQAEAHQHPRGGGWVAETASVNDDSEVSGYSEVSGHSVVRYSEVRDSWVRDSDVRYSVVRDSVVRGHSEVRDAVVSDDSEVSGHSVVRNAVVRNAVVRDSDEILSISPLGSRNATLTFTLSNLSAHTGCFSGTFSEFEKKVKTTYPEPDNQHRVSYLATLQFVKTLWKIAPIEEEPK